MNLIQQIGADLGFNDFVEHNMKVAGCVRPNPGCRLRQVYRTGLPHEIKNDLKVIEAYLGLADQRDMLTLNNVSALRRHRSTARHSMHGKGEVVTLGANGAKNHDAAHDYWAARTDRRYHYFEGEETAARPRTNWLRGIYVS